MLSRQPRCQIRAERDVGAAMESTRERTSKSSVCSSICLRRVRVQRAVFHRTGISAQPAAVLRRAAPNHAAATPTPPDAPIAELRTAPTVLARDDRTSAGAGSPCDGEAGRTVYRCLVQSRTDAV